MFFVIPPPTWKATGIRGKNSLVWSIAGSLILLECKHYCEIGKRRKKMRKWPSTTAFNGNGMMAPHPLLHGFEAVIPREQVWGCREKASFEKAWSASSLCFDAPARGNVSIVCGFWYVALKRILNCHMKTLNSGFLLLLLFLLSKGSCCSWVRLKSVQTFSY